MYIVNAKKDELRNYQIPLHSSIYNFEKLWKYNIMYFVRMSPTDILHYVIIFVYVQGLLIICTALLN